jgi:hypothetical protein
MSRLPSLVTVLIVVVSLTALQARDVRAADQTTDYPVLINCTTFPGEQLCEPVFSQDVETDGTLAVEYIASAGHCSSVRALVAVDGGDPEVSDFLDAGESTGTFDFGPVEAGTYTVTVQAEGTPGGCNTQGLEEWAGTVRVTTSTAEAGSATITIHKATCPTGTDDIFGECHDDGLGGVSFAIDGFEVGSGTITTDADGVASATVLEAAATGDITLTEDPDVFADYLGAYVYCSEQGSGEVLYDGSADTGSVTFTASQGDDIVCDWYNITEADDDDDDDADPTPTATSGGGTTLPDTGTGPDASGTPGAELALIGLLGAGLCLIGMRRLRRDHTTSGF